MPLDLMSNPPEPEERKAIERERRYRLLVVTPSVLIDILKTTTDPRYRTRGLGMPEDLTLVNTSFDWERQSIVLCLYSKGYSVIEEGMKIPVLESWLFRSYYDPAGKWEDFNIARADCERMIEE